MTAPTPIDAGLFESGDFLSDCDDEDLIYFLLNVGDGDTQLLLLPVEHRATGSFRRAVVVDVSSATKLVRLIRTLEQTTLLSLQPGVFALVVGSHPHEDHIGGMPAFLDEFGNMVSDYWEPGYYHPIGSYFETMRALEEHQNIQHGQPTSGLTRFVGNVKLVALSPGITLRNRFDSYGVMINNASISLKVEFPAARVEQRRADRTYLRIRQTQTLILGSDAQTLSWSQVMLDFPELLPDQSPTAKYLRMALGNNPLRAQIFKLPHHGSKHGVNLELVEQILPKLTLVSSVGGGGKYEFPHEVAIEMVREGLQATTSGKVKRKADHELGIHYTSGKDTAGKELGSMAVVISPSGQKRHIWRFGDARQDPVVLTQARLFG